MALSRNREDFSYSKSTNHAPNVFPNRVGPSPPSPRRLNSPTMTTSSCCKSKSMKELENDLDAFRRENFDLKMRIHVMEEQMEEMEKDGKDSASLEELTNLRGEKEILMCQLKEKSNTVLKAGEAVSMLKKNHEEEIRLLTLRYERQIKQMQQKLSQSAEADLQVADNKYNAADELSSLLNENDKLKRALDDREKDLATVKSDLSKATQSLIGFMRANKSLHENNAQLKQQVDALKLRMFNNVNEVSELCRDDENNFMERNLLDSFFVDR